MKHTTYAPTKEEIAARLVANSPGDRLVAQVAALLYGHDFSVQKSAEDAVDAAEAIILEIDRRRRAG